MINHIKQVYASLKIDDGQIQVLVAEYFNTRFNIIDTYVAPLDCVDGCHILDNNALIAAIKKASDEVTKKVGSKLEKVILVLPPYEFSRLSLKVSVIPFNGVLKKSDIARALSNSLKTNVGEDNIVIDSQITKYTINGISTRRFNENEICDEVILDISLLCINKEFAYTYVKAVTNAGLEVLDVTLSSYAIAKESVALDNSINQNIILLDIGNADTYLTLLSKGKLLSVETIHSGLNDLVEKTYNQYHLPLSVVPRLLKYNVDFNGNSTDDTIYVWNDEEVSKSISSNELSSFIKEHIDSFIDKILIMCKPIIDKGANFFITGEGGNMHAIADRLQELSNCEVKNYFPDTIGIRNSNMSGVYGALYIYKEKANLNDLNVACLNLSEYDKTTDKIEVNIEGESITQKIKNLFEIYKDREDI